MTINFPSRVVQEIVTKNIMKTPKLMLKPFQPKQQTKSLQLLNGIIAKQSENSITSPLR